jgi:hypothetical protein
MSKNRHSGSHSSGQQKAAELQNLGAHTHRAAEQGNDPDHLKAHEQTRQAAEHNESPEATGVHGLHTFGHQEIAVLAYQLWEARGCPEGSAEEDWSNAVKELRSQNLRTHAAAAKS